MSMPFHSVGKTIGTNVAVASIATFFFACGEPGYPGDNVGAFTVAGAITSNTCGTNIPLVNPLSFTVELRDDRGVAYWRRPQSALFTGVWSGHQFTFATQEEVRAIEPDPVNGVAGCLLIQSVTILGAVASENDGGIFPDGGDADAGVMSSATGFSGTQTITYTPQTGSDCTALVPPLGSQVAALPCSVIYTLSATRTADF